MSNLLQGFIYEIGPTDATQCDVLLALASHCNEDGESCFPSIARLAKLTRRSERTVIRTLQALVNAEEKWILSISQRTHKSADPKAKKYGSNEYLINAKRLRELYIQSQTPKKPHATVSGDSAKPHDTVSGDSPNHMTLTPKPHDIDDTHLINSHKNTPKNIKDFFGKREGEQTPPPRTPNQAGVWNGVPTPDTFPHDPRAQAIQDRVTSRNPDVSFSDLCYLQEAQQSVLRGMVN